MMKKMTLILLALVVIASLSAKLMQESNAREAITIQSENMRLPENSNTNRNVPDFNFAYDPQFIMANYYDYFPGGYEAIPIRVQPNGDGIYIAFQARPEAGAQRRIYYSYVSNGEVTTTSLVDFENTMIEGFPGIDIDPVTSNPFVAWHVPGPVDPNIYALGFTFDEYSLLNMPGLWNSVYHPVDNLDYPHSVLDHLDAFDEFIWPSLIVGPSPHGAEMRRLYVLGRNFNSNAAGVPCENTLIAWVDYTHHSEIAAFNPEDWSYATVPALDDWRDISVRSFRANTINAEGNLVIVGNNLDLDDDSEVMSPNEVIYVLEATDLDNGEWELYTIHSPIPVDNPLDPDTGTGFFGDPPFQHMNYAPSTNRHNVITDAHGNIHYVSQYTLGNEDNTWFPQFTCVKHIKFNYATHEFEINEMHPNLNSPDLHIPWIVDDNGFIDLDEGLEISYPVYWWGADDFFHENYYRIMSKGNWMIVLFQEASKAYMFHEFNDDDYAAWANVPETYILISNDYGATWQDPIILSSIDTPELTGMIPAYWYIGDQIDHINDEWGRVHLFFLSQNDYGSSIQGNSPDTGGNMYYTALDIHFGEYDDTSTDQVVEAAPGLLRQNYPNPFNPVTNISFNLPSEGRAKIEVFNVKGQLVKTIADRDFSAGEHTVVWNGEDNFNNSAASGVYFYKLTTETETEMKKMLLLK